MKKLAAVLSIFAFLMVGTVAMAADEAKAPAAAPKTETAAPKAEKKAVKKHKKATKKHKKAAKKAEKPAAAPMGGDEAAPAAK